MAYARIFVIISPTVIAHQDASPFIYHTSSFPHHPPYHSLAPTKLIRPILPLFKDLDRKLIRKILIALRPGMQIISTIILWIQLARNLRISKHLIKIHNRIKRPRLSDKLVHALARDFSLRVTVRLAREIGRRAKGGDGCSEDRNAVGVDQSDHLLISLREGVVDGGLCFLGGCAGANVVYAFKYHGVADAGVGEDVAVDAAECIGSETVCEDAVSACGKVTEGDVLGSWEGLETAEEEIGPAVVLVGGGATTVGDGVANDEDGCLFRGNPGLDRREEVPMCCRLRIGIRHSNLGCLYCISELEPACCSRPRMRSNAIRGLTRSEVHGNGNDLCALDREVDRVRHRQSSIWNADTSLARERDFLHSLRLDLVDASCVVGWQRHCDSRDGQIRATEHIGYLESDLVRLCRYKQCLTDGGVDENSTRLVLSKSKLDFSD